jgi:hypothetical protein
LRRLREEFALVLQNIGLAKLHADALECCRKPVAIFCQDQEGDVFAGLQSVRGISDELWFCLPEVTEEVLEPIVGLCIKDKREGPQNFR